MIDQPTKNKMMQAAPAKKEFHFAAGEYFAEVIYAPTIAEAEAEYHKVKRLINPISTPAAAPAKEDVE